MFTVGFLFGSILSFVTFAPKKPEEDDVEYSQGEIRNYQGQLGGINGKNDLPEMVFSKEPEQSPKPTTAFAKKDSRNFKISLSG